MSEIAISQAEVDLALRNLRSWMKDEKVSKNLVNWRRGRGRVVGGLWGLLCSGSAQCVEESLLAACGIQSFPGCLQIKIQNSQLLQHHVCLHAAMLPAIMIMD